jgi:hypothetical protein
MAADDRAIVVGIGRYPGLSNLDGPENDAKSFRDWLIDPMGGALPPKPAPNVNLILSSNYAPPLSSVTAEPAIQAVFNAFDELRVLAEANGAGGFKAGRRLYAYFAGHGFEPQPDQPALLTANAAQGAYWHIASRAWASWFRRACYFDEVLLFMDCCREVTFTFPAFGPPYPDRIGQGTAKWLAGFATQWGRKSREKIIDNTSRGVFTTALLKGLRGGAAVDGEITGASLKEYIASHIYDPLTPAERAVVSQLQVPYVDWDAGVDKRFVIATVPPQRYDVSIEIPAEAGGDTLMVQTIADGDIKTLFQQNGIGAGPFAQTLAAGRYWAQLLPGDRRVVFELPGNGQGGAARVVF